MHWCANDADWCICTGLARRKLEMPADGIIFFHARILGKTSSAKKNRKCISVFTRSTARLIISAPRHQVILASSSERVSGPQCPRFAEGLAFPKVSLQPPTLRERKNDLRRSRALRRFARRRCARAAWPSRVHEREHRDLCRVFRRVFRRFVAPVRKRRDAICIILQ